jgi:hypothetical protein
MPNRQLSLDGDPASHPRVAALPYQSIVCAAKGERVLRGSWRSQTYRLIEGEILVLRHGVPIDLVEAGDYIDARIWPDATLLAWTDCRMMVDFRF